MNKLLLAVLVTFAMPVLAQHQVPPGADPNQFQPLPERKDVVSWKLLAQVELVKQKDRYVPQFARDVAALDQKQVKVQGFMMPLEVGDKLSHFVLSAMPQTCERYDGSRKKAPVDLWQVEPYSSTGRVL